MNEGGLRLKSGKVQDGTTLSPDSEVRLLRHGVVRYSESCTFIFVGYCSLPILLLNESASACVHRFIMVRSTKFGLSDGIM